SAEGEGASASVELYRAALDAIHTEGSAEQVGTLDQDLTRLGQRDAGLPAAQDDLLLGRDDETFSVRIHLDSPRLLGHAPGTFTAHAAHHDWTHQITALKHDHDVMPDVLAMQVDDSAGSNRYRAGLPWVDHERRCAVISETYDLPDCYAVGLCGRFRAGPRVRLAS